MRQRVISALVGLVILGVALVFIDTLLLNVMMAVISFIALYEMLRATGCLKSRGLTALSFLMSLIIPFSSEPFIRKWAAELIFLFFVAFFILLIRNSTTTRVEQTSMAFMFSIFIPLFFFCAVLMRDLFGSVVGSFYLLMALSAAWLSDTGAYFVGRKFGKHKLAPIVSPKKTVEGAIGGLVFSTVIMLAFAAAFYALMLSFGIRVKINYMMLTMIMPVCSVLGMLGDLSASVIKRQFNVKDYGTIMPGHGGVMDRFDSVLFTLPSVYIVATHLHVIVVV